MKLSDIHVLVARRDEFKKAEALLEQCLSGNGLSVKYGDHYIINDKVLTKVKEVLLQSSQKEYDEAKTRLMMLGVTEFPDVPTTR